MNVVEFPRLPQVDAQEFLSAIVEDMQSGHILKTMKGLLVLENIDGGYSIWSFGPEGGGDHVPIALASLAQALLIDKILGE